MNGILGNPTSRPGQALRLLENRGLDIQQVALPPGDRDPGFTRAFRRWSGRTPSQARAERNSAPC